MFPRYLLIGLLFVSVGLADPGLPDDFEATYHSLAGMIDVETLTPLEMARGTYDATRFFAVGKPGVPLLEQHYRRATTLGQATLAGLYLTVWGQQRQFDMIRAELERNKTKRRLIYSLAGTEPIFFSSLTAGAQYQPLLRLFSISPRESN